MSEIPERWHSVCRLLEYSGPFALDGFEADLQGKGLSPFSKIHQVAGHEAAMKVLVVGAGGLGCEILKDLALSGFTDLHVIDMDTIDISNLNRQFLFRSGDVGSPKAEVAARAIMARVPGVHVTAHFSKLQDHGLDFYRKFKLVVAGLDSIEARRFLNTQLLELVEFDDDGAVDPQSLVPLVDGGTEAFKGQARVIIPALTACFECTIDLFPPRVAFQICTVTNTPRQPEHCIEWARLMAWPKEEPFGAGVAPDMDIPEHLRWMFERASARAEEFNIAGVTLSATKGVVKNIIPAIASTNAVIAAACCNEALKLATSMADNLDNYFYYSGSERIYSYSFSYEKREDCLACGRARIEMTFDTSAPVQNLMDAMGEHPMMQFKKPSLSVQGGERIYMWAPPAMEKHLSPNLERPLADFLSREGGVLDVMDPSMGSTHVVEVVIKNSSYSS